MKLSSPFEQSDLFARVVSILETARTRVVCSVNSEMVTAYWLIGREIVEGLQRGDERAEYGKMMIEKLSIRLNQHFGKGFSESNLFLFRQFYMAFRERSVTSDFEFSTQCVENSAGFMSNLGWSHYRILMRVSNSVARAYYEREASMNSWSVRQLERQVHSLFFERLLKSKDQKLMREKMVEAMAETHPIDIVKDPYVLEFLDLPASHELTETAIENALISSLQTFLLELGSGFAFVARQKRLTLDGDHFYPDLIFYHMRLKCYVVLDLKAEKLTYGDVGQMQLYVNYYDREIRAPDDNPTVGLLLCTEKNDAMVRYILGENNQQIFAAKYQFELPTLDELQAELTRERLRIEESGVLYG
jgi:predicted nuclease of restriction endonuclease-like (RecB) superfamily